MNITDTYTVCSPLVVAISLSDIMHSPEMIWPKGEFIGFRVAAVQPKYIPNSLITRT